jgi:hypothetical protein
MTLDTDFKTLVQGLRSGDQFAIHQAIFDEYAHKIGPYALAVYAALVMHADDTPPPSARVLAQELGLSRPTIFRAIRTLKSYGLMPCELQKAPQPNPEGDSHAPASTP